MIKKAFTLVLVLFSLTTTTIAQTQNFVEELNTPSYPQNYLYGTIPEPSQEYPMYNLEDYRNGSIISSKVQRYSRNLGFTPWYCTVYVANRRPDLFPGRGRNLLAWDAKYWFQQAKDQWLSTGKIPKVWSIAVFAPWRGALSLGHVAYVEYIGDDGLIVVSDMNFVWKFIVTERVVSADLPIWYIY